MRSKACGDGSDRHGSYVRRVEREKGATLGGTNAAVLIDALEAAGPLQEHTSRAGVSDTQKPWLPDGRVRTSFMEASPSTAWSPAATSVRPVFDCSRSVGFAVLSRWIFNDYFLDGP